MSLPLYILKRLLAAIPTLLVVSMIGFFLMRFNFTVGPIDIPTGGGQAIHVMDKYVIKNPIDPLGNLKNNPAITASALKQERERLGLDQPMHVQYWRWLSSVLQFHPEALMRGNPAGFFTPNFGKTFQGEEVTQLITERAGNTLVLNLIVILLTWIIAIPLGVFAALHWRSQTDRLMTALAAIGMSFPSFVLALILAIWAVQNGWPPYGGLHGDNYAALDFFSKIADRAQYLILPVSILTVSGLAGLQRQMRGNLLDVLEAEYVRAARAKGLPESTVIRKHALRNAVNPLITMMGLEFSALLGGSILIETVLAYPGLGQLTYKAALETDTNLVMASLMMSVVMLVLGNLLSDILLKIVDPRIELE